MAITSNVHGDSVDYMTMGTDHQIQPSSSNKRMTRHVFIYKERYSVQTSNIKN